ERDRNPQEPESPSLQRQKATDKQTARWEARWASIPVLENQVAV
ncbi:hypothetical protein A2U01_0085772, partial [Trifolium medium]|nr:hypothetical protein [Trifolium medium]